MRFVIDQDTSIYTLTETSYRKMLMAIVEGRNWTWRELEAQYLGRMDVVLEQFDEFDAARALKKLDDETEEEVDLG